MTTTTSTVLYSPLTSNEIYERQREVFTDLGVRTMELHRFPSLVHELAPQWDDLVRQAQEYQDALSQRWIRDAK